MRKIMNTLLAGGMLLLLLLTAACGKSAPEPVKSGKIAGEPPLVVKVLDIGQGDAILIRTPSQTVLVDTGDVNTRERLIGLLKAEKVTVIDKLILTHGHADHIGGVAAVLDQFPVRQVYDSGFPTTTALYQQYLTQVKRKQIPFALLEAGTMVELGSEARLQVLAPEKPYLQEGALNNSSIVVKLIYGDFSMLLAGDAEKESEQRMVARFKGELKSTVLKSPHHGSSSSSTAPFLQAAAPESVVISLGANNDYHHPHPSVMKRYEGMKLKIFRTDQHGTVTIKSDGKQYEIVKEKG